MSVRPASAKKPYQLSFPDFGPLNDAVVTLAQSSNQEERGAIFTRGEVVEFILDLVGYTTEKPLHQMRLLEPSVGEGDFLIPAIKRLLNSWRRHSRDCQSPEAELSKAVFAVELHAATYSKVYNKIFNLLVAEGIEHEQASSIVNSWLVQGDFLLTDVTETFHFIVGNPPYVRQELIPDVLLREYRLRYHTIYDRADLYIPFIERSLTLLEKDGLLGFICADRWMKNRYGGPLRKFISDSYHLKFYVDMVDTQAFQSEVSAYPAVTVFTRKKEKTTKIVHRPNIHGDELSRLASILALDRTSDIEPGISEIEGIAAGSEPWILEAPDQLALVRKLESKFPLLEEAGCKVGIGVATGLDKIFIGRFDDLDIEPDRKLPLVMTRDIQGDSVSWRGLGVINPFNGDGSLVDLNRYPRLKKYLNDQKQLIIKRHVASKNPNNWYRTIDRIYPEIATQPKLLIPDIKGKAHIIYEDGKLYPHHNLYYITSNSWDLRALQAVLQSGIARLFVSIYSIKMRGGYLRFQAQYLRRIRIPHWEDVPDGIKQELLIATKRNDILACNAVVFKLYGLSKAEREAIGGNGE